jgi:glucose/arabinose dehydrogenase
MPTAPTRLLACLSLALLFALDCRPAIPTPTPAASPTAANCATSPSTDDDPEDDCPNDPVRHPPNGLPQLLPTPVSLQAGDGPIRVETVADGLSMPLGLAWTPDGSKLYFSEVKLGRIRIVVNGALQPQPFVTLPIARGAETGMLGLAVDPDYSQNHFVYAYHSDPASGRNQVLRFEDHDGSAVNQTAILQAVVVSPQGGAHNAGRLAFGPDKMLYVSVGNGQNTKIGQDPCKLGGKILRVNREGGRPADDPFECSATFALGFRNPFGLAFHPLTGELFASDNGGHGHDELDLVRAQGNYGHPIVEGAPHNPLYVDPLFETGPVSIGPTGLAFYSGDRLPEFKNDLFFCGVHTGQLGRVRLTAPKYDQVEAMNVEILKDQVDCRLDVANGPDGALYFSNFSKIARLTR